MQIVNFVSLKLIFIIAGKSNIYMVIREKFKKVKKTCLDLGTFLLKMVSKHPERKQQQQKILVQGLGWWELEMNFMLLPLVSHN